MLSQPLFKQKQRVWTTYMHKPAIVLNILSSDLCQVDTGNGPVLVHMSDLQDFEKALDTINGVPVRPCQIQSNLDFFKKIEPEFAARAEAARWHPEIKTRRA